MAPTPAPLGKQYNEESEWIFKAMTKLNEPNLQRRRFLTAATSFVAGAGLVRAAIPYVQSWKPSAKAKAAGAPVKFDPGKIEPGAMITVPRPVFFKRIDAGQILLNDGGLSAHFQ